MAPADDGGDTPAQPQDSPQDPPLFAGSSIGQHQPAQDRPHEMSGLAVSHSVEGRRSFCNPANSNCTPRARYRALRVQVWPPKSFESRRQKVRQYCIEVSGVTHPRGRWMKATINSTTGSVQATGSVTDPVTGLVPTFELTWAHNPKYSHYCYDFSDSTQGRLPLDAMPPSNAVNWRVDSRPYRPCHEATRLIQNFDRRYFYAVDNRKQFGDLNSGRYIIDILGYTADLHRTERIGTATVTIVDTAAGSVLPQGTWAGTGVGEQ